MSARNGSMRPPVSLRRRVALAFTALGFMLSVVFAVATLFVTEDYEYILVDEILLGQAEDYGLRLAVNPDTPLPQTHRLSGYRVGIDPVPAAYASLAPGLHEIEDPPTQEGIHIGVFDTDQGRLIFVLDLRDIERLERHLFAFVLAMVVLGTVLAGWLGWLLAGRTIAPVHALADAVDGLSTRPEATSLADGVSHDDLGRLAGAIDRYQSRLVQADAHERAFFADASHELRTPIAVVRGATEVLLDEPDTAPGMRGRLQRLDRGMQELADLLEVLLDLARHREPQPERLAAEPLLREASMPWSSTGNATTIQGDMTLWASRRESLLVLRGTLRRLVPAGARGQLLLGCGDDGIQLVFRPHPDMAGIDAQALPEHGERALGLTLITRLGEQMGWRIRDLEVDKAERRIHIQLDPPTAD